jgi:hypothetical protein
VDGSSLTLSDPAGKRGMGSIGTYRSKAQGLKVMNAIGVDVDGTPLGLLAQHWWTRPRARVAKKHHHQRVLAEKETRHWLEVIDTVEERFKERDCRAVPWFQLDSEGDFREMIQAMDGRTSFITVRATHNRRVADPELRDLWTSLDAQPSLGRYGLTVRPGLKRKGREACIEVRSCQVKLRLRDQRINSRGPYQWVTLSAVLALEVGTTPMGEKPIRWLLLTNHPVTSFHDACEVIFGYSQRWRVEDFHRTWKSHCHVQDSQLRAPSRVQLWATILAAIAMRAERLKHLARNEPLQPASVEFSPEEIDAIIVLRRPSNVGRGCTPSMADAVRWVADLGGYTGKSSGGPPGSIVIGRGLAKVDIAVLTLRNIAPESGP